MGRVLVTGAEGFVGRALGARLESAGYAVLPVARNSHDGMVGIGDITGCDRWPALLTNVDSVVHLAARAHVLHERSADPLAEFRRVNVLGTLRLAEAAAAAGVRRFVFLSSIGVNGRRTLDRPFSESDAPNPWSPYAISKWEAEQALLEIGARTGLEITRVRPPLVVGPGPKGNLRRLIGLVATGVPLPFGKIRNRRSFVGLDDLCGLLTTCVSHERARGELFVVASDEELATPDLLRAIAEGLGRRPRVFSVPPLALKLAAFLVGAGEQLAQLTSSLVVDSDKARHVLGWRARDDLRAGIRTMAAAYLESARR